MSPDKPKYISLRKATQSCSYSQEYLKLRARQGKLKAVKIGRDWVTTKEWVEEYIRKVEEYNNLKAKKIKKIVAPPENLPTEIPKMRPVPKIRFAFSLVLVFVLLIAGITFGKESFKNVYRDIEPYTYIVGGAGDIIVENTIKVLADTIFDIPQSLSRTKLALVRGFVTVSLTTASIGDVFQEYDQWL